MEIEAKWEIDQATYDRLVAAFPDNQESGAYSLRVRWGGKSRKFSDIYYDTTSGQLAKELHSLRHRTQYAATVPDNHLSSLKNAQWTAEWERVQYKSTPCRIGAVWFRVEKGDCRIWDKNDKGLCKAIDKFTAQDVIHGNLEAHDGIGKLVQDHSKGGQLALDLGKLAPVLEVTDYRYRVEFVRTALISGEQKEIPVYEMSLDRLSTGKPGSSSTITSYEAEVEVIEPDFDENAVQGLFKFSESMQYLFTLKPSTKSKGGIGDPAEGLDIAECGKT